MNPLNNDVVLMSGVVGSHAYGLAHENSDVDRLGVFAAHPMRLMSWDWDTSCASRVKNSPDVTMHEVRKYLMLVLSCNPTVMELLWLSSHEEFHPLWGHRIQNLRTLPFCVEKITNAYGGYAHSQRLKVEKWLEGKEREDEQKERQTRKAARHCLRLLRQGASIMETGALDLRVRDVEVYRSFHHAEWHDILDVLKGAEDDFQRAKSHPVVPREANPREQFAAVLHDIRHWHMVQAIS